MREVSERTAEKTLDHESERLPLIRPIKLFKFSMQWALFKVVRYRPLPIYNHRKRASYSEIPDISETNIKKGHLMRNLPVTYHDTTVVIRLSVQRYSNPTVVLQFHSRWHERADPGVCSRVTWKSVNQNANVWLIKEHFRQFDLY